MSNTLVLKPINDLLQEKFFVPSYQRGYRWTNDEVVALLDDIWEFEDKNSEGFYCLQPIVVEKIKDEYALIDGQQRLTTIYLIFLNLEKHLPSIKGQCFTLRYNTRSKSEDILKNGIDISREHESIDLYHICNAYKAIDNWFKNKNISVPMKFLPKLLEETKVIWYEVSNEENRKSNLATDIFTRINIGKIQLTNAELIKALFLSKDSPYYQNKIKQKKDIELLQIQIATEWDSIERALQKNEFWSFIYDGNQKYDTRIEYIFDLIQGKDAIKDEKNYTFNEYSKALKNDPNIELHWKEVKNHFLLFDEWYNDAELFHLIGFLILADKKRKKIIQIVDIARNSTKLNFKQYLNNEVKSTMEFGVEIEDLKYEKHNDEIRLTLLLFNIATLIANKDANVRFSFEKYKEGTWHIEHIRSQTDKEIKSKEERIQWIKDNLEYFFGIDDFEQQKKIFDRMDEEVENYQIIEDMIKFDEDAPYSKTTFKTLFENTQSYFKEKGTDEEKLSNPDNISNLALLNAHINCGYKNAFFPIKRKVLIKEDSKGTFIPLCTKNVFLKSYSKKLSEVMFWQQNDANDYLEAIKKTLSNYQNY